MKEKWWFITGLALGLPSTILGVAFIVKILWEKNYISKNTGLIILILIVAQIFYLMIHYAFKKNKS